MTTQLECFASVKKNTSGSVFVRVSKDRRVKHIFHWSPLTTLQVADAMRLSLYDADARARGTFELRVSGDVLEVELARVEPIADALTCAASRASGVRA